MRGFDIEARRFHLGNEVRRVLVQAVLEFVRTGEYLEGLDSCGCNHRRNRVREEIRTRTLTQQVDDLFLTGCKTTYRTAKGFAERAGDDFYFAAHVIEFRNTVSGLTYHTGRVALVHHNQCIVFLRQFVNLIQRTYITVHREDAVGRNDTETLRLSFLELLLEVCHVAVRITITHRLAKTYAVDYRRMVESIRDDRVLFRQQWFKQASVGVKASGIKDSVLCAEEIGDDTLKFFVSVLCTADETHRRHAVAPCIHAVLSCLNQLFVIRQTEVVVCAEVYHFLSTFHGNTR